MSPMIMRAFSILSQNEAVQATRERLRQFDMAVNSFLYLDGYLSMEDAV